MSVCLCGRNRKSASATTSWWRRGKRRWSGWRTTHGVRPKRVARASTTSANSPRSASSASSRSVSKGQPSTITLVLNSQHSLNASLPGNFKIGWPANLFCGHEPLLGGYAYTQTHTGFGRRDVTRYVNTKGRRRSKLWNTKFQKNFWRPGAHQRAIRSLLVVGSEIMSAVILGIGVVGLLWIERSDELWTAPESSTFSNNLKYPDVINYLNIVYVWINYFWTTLVVISNF